MRLSATFIGIICLLGAAPFARADDAWSLTTSDFKRQAITLKGMDDKGLSIARFGSDAQTQRIPMNQFLQLERGAAAQPLRGAWTLYLLSGDRVGGEPTGMAQDTLAWNSPATGKLDIPLKEIRGLARGQDPVQFDPARTEDAVFLNNGDTVKGILAKLEDGKFFIQLASGDTLPVSIANSRSLHLASGGKPETAGRQGFRVQLSDGSAITVARLQLKGDQLSLGLPGQGGNRAVDLAQVVMIEQVNGPVSWLSARFPDLVVHKPMFDIAFPPQMDRNYRGEKIKFNGREYPRGIGVHAYTKMTWSLDGRYKVLRTQYALNEDAYKGRVTVRILLDDKVVHEAVDFGAGKLSPLLLIDLGAAKTLTFEAHPGGDTSSDDPTRWNIDTQARLNWLEPALLLEKPQAGE